MKIKVMLASMLAIACLGLSACGPDKEKSSGPADESSIPVEITSEEPIESSEPVESSEDPVSSEEPPHVHEFGEWSEVTPATCTEKGLKERVCECGEKEQEEIEALGHLPKAEWEVVTPATVEAEGEEVLKCERCDAVLESRKIDKLDPPAPSIDPIVLTDAALLGYAGTNISYGDGNATIGGVKFSFVECGAYGNGIQMRTKSGKSSTILNEDALPGAIKQVKIKLNDGKQVYANEHALTLSFGDSAACDKGSLTWDTVADQKSYTIDISFANCNYIKVVHSITYSLYVDTIELVF